MTGLVDSAVVRFRTQSGTVVGGGFYVGERRVLTCAHVVARALGLHDRSAPPPDAQVHLDFPLVPGSTTITANVAVWDPPDARGEGDVAGLELIGDPPEGATAARLLVADDLWRHEFRTIGFPPGYDDGVWASGRLLGRQAVQWIQMEDTTQTGYRIEPGFSGAPVWDDELNGVVGITVAAEVRPEVRAAYLIPSSILVGIWPILAAQSIPPCPYRGLMAFREQDAKFFFGREKLTEQLVEAIDHRPLIAVVGSSGSGKSSLVFAGLLPLLRRRSEWVITTLRIGTAPVLEALAASLLPLLESEMTEAERLGQLPALAAVLREGRLGNVVERIAEKRNARRVLLVIDQFEELFTLESTDRRQYLNVLLQALTQQARRDEQIFRLVLTLRADFLGQVLRYAELSEALQEANFLVGSMTVEQLQRAITAPAEHQVRYEPGLVERILHDVGEERGNLPLLEFALTLLWERQTGGRLTHAAYDDLDGVSGALVQHAEEAYLQLPEPEREAAHQIFLQLVQPGEGTESTRRVAHRGDFSEDRWLLVQRLATSRLVVTGRRTAGTETVEVVHEALISNWDRLRGWIEADHAFRAWQERLRSALRQWEASGRDDGALLRGAPLADSERWLKQRQADIGQTEQVFIQSSKTLQGRSLRRLRSIAVALSVLLAVALVLAVIAVQRNQLAQEQSRLATSRYLVTEANNWVDTQPDLAILLTLTAYSNEKTAEARKSLLEQAYRRRDARALLTGHTDPATSVAFNPNGDMLASGSEDSTVILWDIVHRTRLASLAGHKQGVTSVAFSPGGDILASGSRDNTIVLWDIARRTRLATLQNARQRVEIPGSSGVTSVAFSPDGGVLASGGEDGTVTLWDVSQRKQLANRRVHRQRISSIAFSPDGHTLASGGNDHRIVLWNFRQRTRPTTLGSLAHSNGVADLAFSPNGNTLATATDSPDEYLVLWDVSKRKRLAELTGGNAGSLQANSVAFSPDGQTIASLSADNVISIWSVTQRIRLRSLTGQTDTVRDIAFSPDGKTLAASSDDRTIVLFDTDPSSPMGGLPPERKGNYGAVSSLTFSPSGAVLASADGNTITLWDVDRRIRLAMLRGRKQQYRKIAFSLDGRTLASVSNNEVDIWNVSTHKETATIEIAPDSSVSVSRDGRTLATLGKKVTLWDTFRASPIGSLSLKDRSLGRIALSPDGRILAGATWTGRVVLWDVASRTEIGTINVAQSFDAPLLAFSPDGGLLATADDRQIIFWDVASRTRREALRNESIGFQGLETDMAFSPDGQLLVLGSDNETQGDIVLWDIARRAPLGKLAGGGAT